MTRLATWQIIHHGTRRFPTRLNEDGSTAEGLSTRLGEPSYRGQSKLPDYPQWALGELATVWAQHHPPLYLTLWSTDYAVLLKLAHCGYQPEQPRRVV